jgi:hypothetical protein
MVGLCLNGGRFIVEGLWRKKFWDSAYYWYFYANPSNMEIINGDKLIF